MKIKTLLFFALLIFTGVFLIGRFMDSGRMMIPEFTVPYFSGAALMQVGSPWQFNLNEVDTLKELQSIPDKKLSVEKINSYRFSSEIINARSYSINQPGYLYIVFLARYLFWWTGDIGAVKLFQLLIHSLVSLMVILLLKKNSDRLLFFLLFTLNPFLIYFALYPFYYFWELLPSALLVYFYLSRKKKSLELLLILALILAFLFHVRSSVLIISVLTLLIASAHLPYPKKAGLFLFFFLALWIMKPVSTAKHPGHVMYTSLGAYPNATVQNFSDSISWNAYRNSSGVDYTYITSPGMYDASVFFGESRWCLAEYKKIAVKDPLMIFRNATLNFFQCFSVGYFRSSLTLSYLSSLLGLIFFLLLILQKKFKHLLAISAASCTFFPYLAPLPVYLYGSYLLLIISFIESLQSSKFWTRIQQRLE